MILRLAVDESGDFIGWSEIENAGSLLTQTFVYGLPRYHDLL
jgi:hypothetical protein